MLKSLWDRGRSVPPMVLDSGLAVALALLTWATMAFEEGCRCPMPAWAPPVILGQTLPLAFRRRAPVAVWAVVGVVSAIHGASELSDPTLYFGALVALYTVASRCSRRTSVAVACVTAVAVLAAIVASGDTGFVEAALSFLMFGTAWILGDSVRVHRA